MVAAVYVVGGPTDDDRADLRHSLRSLAVNAPVIDEVWIVGDVPSWCRGVKMPAPPLPEKFANQRQSLTWFVNYPGAPDEFYLFNDDMFVTERVDGPLPIYRNKSRASAWATAEKADGRTLNGWHRTVMATASWVAECTDTDPFIYEAHVPLLFHRRKLQAYLNAYPMNQPFAVGELYPVAGAGGEGVHAGNAKCKSADSLEAKLASEMPYLSGNPDSWAGALGDLIRARFPEPCRWER